MLKKTALESRSGVSLPGGRPRPTAAALLVCASLLVGVRAAHAEGDASPVEEPAGFLDKDSLSGNWGGLRTNLKDTGIALGATETSEAFGILQAGARHAVYEGRFEADLDLDLEKILGLHDTVLHANAYQIHGRGPSANYLGGNLLTASNIEAVRATRLFDLWVQTGFFDAALSVRLGQIAADDEFMTSRYAGGLVGATFGWPAIMGVDLPSGGPVYPLATPGIRVKGAFADALSMQAAVFNGDPAGAVGTSDPQHGNASGTAFSIGRNAFAILEAEYAPVTEGLATPASVYKLGAWYDSGPFRDPDSVSNRVGNFGLYITIDQSLYRQADSPDLGLGAFLRISGTRGDRNLISLYADAGLAYRGPVAGRPDDLLSLGLAFAQIGSHARRYDSGIQHLGFGAPARNYETALELTYQIAIAAWWSIQPDLQYIFHPTQAVLQPSPGSTAQGGDAVIVGLRTSIGF